MLQAIRQGLARWKALPASERKPGAVKVPDLAKTDARYTRTPPKGGLIVNVSTRILDLDKKTFVRGTCRTPGGASAARDHLWLTKTDWQSLIPADATKGKRFEMPAHLAERILRFHLLDNTRGEPNYWQRNQLRKRSLTWIVESVSEKELRLSLEGSALLATDADTAKAARGFDVALRGHLHYDRVRKVITRFDLVAVGEHWGEGTYTRRARPGRKPLGIAFELSPGKAPGDLVPPQGAREVGAYLRGSR
jgi:hypothetical protein